MVSTVFISLPTGPPSLVSEPPVLPSRSQEGPGIGSFVLLEGVAALVDDVVNPVEGVVALVEGVIVLVDGVNAGNAISKDCLYTDCLYVCVYVIVLVLCV